MPNAPIFSELGSTGLNQWGGHIREEYLRELIGVRGMKVFREMSNDDIIGACLFAITTFAGQTDWMVKTVDQTPNNQDAEKKEFLETALFKDMQEPFTMILSEILTMLIYGFAPMEIVYKKRGGPDTGNLNEKSNYTDGRIGWRKWPIRAQETVDRWQFEQKSGEVEGFWQKTNDRKPVFIPSEKFLHFRTSLHRGNPEGRSILRNAYIKWWRRRRLEELEGIGVERNVAGLPVLTGPEGVDFWNPHDEDAQFKAREAQKLVTNIRVDEQMGVVLPFGWELELLAAAGAASKADTSAIITRYDQRIAMTMFADMILIGHEAVGSKALSVTKQKGFSKAVTSFLDIIRDVINMSAVPRLWELNGWPIERLPYVDHGEVEDIDLAELGEYLKNLTAAGIPLLPNTNLEEYTHTAAHLPAPPEGFEERAKTLEAEEAERMEMEQEFTRELAEMKAKPVPGQPGPAKPQPKPRPAE
jgi:hypothetical protein